MCIVILAVVTVRSAARCIVKLFFSDTQSITTKLPAALSWSSPVRGPLNAV